MFNLYSASLLGFQIILVYSWKDKRIDDLSKGMAQKIQFISTIIHEPELLILDEPFSGFDPMNAEIIKNEIIFEFIGSGLCLFSKSCFE